MYSNVCSTTHFLMCCIISLCLLSTSMASADSVKLWYKWRGRRECQVLTVECSTVLHTCINITMPSCYTCIKITVYFYDKYIDQRRALSFWYMCDRVLISYMYSVRGGSYYLENVPCIFSCITVLLSLVQCWYVLCTSINVPDMSMQCVQSSAVHNTTE